MRNRFAGTPAKKPLPVHSLWAVGIFGKSSTLETIAASNSLNLSTRRFRDNRRSVANTDWNRARFRHNRLSEIRWMVCRLNTENLVEHSNIVAELLLGMREIARFILAETGHKPSRSTLWRWHLTGRLQARRIGGRLYATETAVRAMLAADEQRNCGSVNSRGEAAAARLANLVTRDTREEVA